MKYFVLDTKAIIRICIEAESKAEAQQKLTEAFEGYESAICDHSYQIILDRQIDPVTIIEAEV